MAYRHFEFIEKHAWLLGILIAVGVSLGGLAEITPLYFQALKVRPADGTKPYDALRLTGRDVYVREGCYLCHSQMIRTLRFETQRYGHFSTANESVYDRPFQWGSKRTGPDLARVGGKYSDLWHVDHLNDPRSVVPTSIMPGYPFLSTTPLKTDDIQDHMKAQAALGVPYSKEMIANALSDLRAQASNDAPEAEDLRKRYQNVIVRKFDNNKAFVSEADAIVAYLQMLGTQVDFKAYQDKANLR